MDSSNAASAGDPAGRGPWTLAWRLFAPLAMWLVLAKTLLVMSALHAAPYAGSGGAALLQWLWSFTLLRFALALLAGWVIQQLAFPRHRWLGLPIAACLMVALAVAVSLFKASPSWLDALQLWSGTAWGQLWGLGACLWRDAISLALVVLVAGLVLWIVPARARVAAVRTLQVLVVLLCALVGIDLAYELGTGQPASLRVLHFAATHLPEMLPLIRSETTPLGLLAIAGGILLAVAWAWRERRLAYAPLTRGMRGQAVGAATLALSLAFFLPAPSPLLLPLLRHAESKLIDLARSLAPRPVDEASASVRQAFERSRYPPWYDDHLILRPTPQAKDRNVVLVMLESVRAKSTSLHDPGLRTTPFLKDLADKGLLIEEMSAVIPRTAAAWMAILGGKYPLSNERTADWVHAHGREPEARSLVSALGGIGYATAFFTPTDLRFQNDVEMVDAFGFDTVKTEIELTRPGAERVTYFGVADELMVQPILDWSQAQRQAQRPFFAAIMTNVGHHDFRTPASWRKVRFEGVSNPQLEAYYNCLLYVDGVLRQLVDGYRALGLLEDTVFVFVGDHGQMFDEHNARQTYNAVYQEGLHVPALIYAPGMPLGPGVVKGPRLQVDILPTIAELLGYSIEGARLPGVSLLQPVAADRRLFFSSSIDWTFLAARRGSRKYIYSFDRKPMEVFDLERDPHEAQPLQIDEQELAQVRREMLEWRMQAALSMMARPAASGEWTLAGNRRP